jgi:hypothetical protein
MIEVQLSTKTLTQTIVTFYANRVEFFFVTAKQGGRSYHVGHIRSFGLSQSNGKNYLLLTTEYTQEREEVDAAALPKATELVAAVQQAMQTFRSG